MARSKTEELGKEPVRIWVELAVFPDYLACLLMIKVRHVADRGQQPGPVGHFEQRDADDVPREALLDRLDALLTANLPVVADHLEAGAIVTIARGRMRIRSLPIVPAG
jgi:hypothetical protein